VHVDYVNTKTGRTVRLSEPSPLMDRSTRWMRVLGEVELIDVTPMDRDPDTDPEHIEVPVPVFDPGAHTVAEVNEHLAEADDAERERVRQAEADGKGRAGVLRGPHADLSGAE
jgi:hypothetical protein